MCACVCACSLHPILTISPLVMAVTASAVGVTPQSSLFVPRLKKTYEFAVVEKVMESDGEVS